MQPPEPNPQHDGPHHPKRPSQPVPPTHPHRPHPHPHPAHDPTRATLWVIYERPSDYPNYFVVRDLHFHGTDPIDYGPATLFGTLEDARAHCQYMGLTRVPRDPSDDPVIVESWV